MNVNIICTSSNRDGILWRMAAALANATGWALSAYPNDRADVNYYICYIDVGEKYSDWHLTPVAAWFTHYETGTPFKKFWWDTVATKCVDLRLTSARQYADILRQNGMTELVTPFIEREHFTPGPPLKHTRPVIGVSGFVHPGGRKGEKLVARLAGSKLGKQVAMIASGKGWPVQTREYGWQDMPKFYRSLSVLLCTASQEGIPAPPLEALACGIPVVIPQGVGMLDDLPDIPGIVRYPAGDYEAMENAVREAIELNGIDREALRAATERYTVAQWAADHQAAFEALLAGRASVASTESDRHGQRGVYYVAYGEQARNCARAGIASFREFMPGIPVALVAAKAGDCGEDIFIDHPDVDVAGRAAKMAIYDAAPKEWQYIMYLDADTQIIADVSFLYDILLDGWDMVVCKDAGATAEKMRRHDNGDEIDYTFSHLGTHEVIPLNGGVFAFQRNERTAAFFHAWQEEWGHYGKRDQAALLRALWRCPVKLYVLGKEWNSLQRPFDNTGHLICPREQSAGILHFPMAARRTRQKIYHRLDSKEAWAALNAQGVKRDG